MLVPATTRIIVYCASVLAMIGAYRLSGSPSAEITAAVAAFVAGIELTVRAEKRSREVSPERNEGGQPSQAAAPHTSKWALAVLLGVLVGLVRFIPSGGWGGAHPFYAFMVLIVSIEATLANERRAARRNQQPRDSEPHRVAETTFQHPVRHLTGAREKRR